MAEPPPPPLPAGPPPDDTLPATTMPKAHTSSASSWCSSPSSPGSSSTAQRCIIYRASCLGKGSFGCVYKGLDRVSGQIVAVKEAVLTTKEAAKQLVRELKFLADIQHEHVVRFVCGDVCGDKSYVVMELMPGGSLQSVLTRLHFRLHEQVIRQHFREALSGLAYLHSRNIVHRDIKPGNMLLTVDGVLKLSDFGLSRRTDGSSATATLGGTVRFMPPESLKQSAKSPAADIWALACSVLQMATNQLPWTHLPEDMESFALIFRIGGATPPDHLPWETMPDHLSGMLKGIVLSCFEFDPTQRPTAESLLQHEYFKNPSLPDDAETLDDYSEQLASIVILQDSQTLEEFEEWADFLPTEEDDGRTTAALMFDEPAQEEVPVPPLPTTAPTHSPAAESSRREATEAARGRDGWSLPVTLVEFEDDNGSWRKVAESVRVPLLAALQRDGDGGDRGQIRATAFGHRYVIDVAALTQRNVVTNKVRRLRVRRGRMRMPLKPAFMNEHGHWVPLTPEFVRAISAALDANERYVRQTYNGQGYELDLQALVQRNRGTNVRRLLSLRETDRIGACEVAEYLGGDSSWHPFDPAVSRLLVFERDHGDAQLELAAGRNRYVLDFVAGKQTEVSSGNSRPIRFTNSATAS